MTGVNCGSGIRDTGESTGAGGTELDGSYAGQRGQRGRGGGEKGRGREAGYLFIYFSFAGCIYVSWPGDPGELGVSVGGILCSHFVCFVR